VLTVARLGTIHCETPLTFVFDYTALKKVYGKWWRDEDDESRQLSSIFCCMVGNWPSLLSLSFVKIKLAICSKLMLVPACSLLSSNDFQIDNGQGNAHNSK
jgi:hypothetical protein